MILLHHALFPQYADARWKWLDLETESRAEFHEQTNPLIDPVKCAEWVQTLHRRNQVDFSFGGYMEYRTWLWRGHYHESGKTLHVGLDYNVPAGTFCRLPLPGRLILVEEDPDQNGGWGTRMIFKMGEFFVTFAHMNLPYGTVGTDYQPGHVFGEVGNHRYNGGWYPHLHVQVQKGYKPAADGYQFYSKELEHEFLDPESVLLPSEIQ